MQLSINICLFLVVLGIVCSSSSVASADAKKILTLYHDADWSNHTESAQSIWRGFNTALSEIDYQAQGYTLELVKKDHSGNVVRSKKNMRDFLNDKNALAIISGIHSPPLIKHREFINKNKILTLVPWAAGGPITRFPSRENWVFRVSIDDTKAGGVLVNFALKEKSCQSPHLLLENSLWGLSNLKNISHTLKLKGQAAAGITHFDWSIKSYTAQRIINDIIQDGGDCIILIGNAIESAELMKAMANVPPDKQIPVISHWGVTAGKFHEDVKHDMRSKIDLTFIQSCFSFMKEPLSKKGQYVFSLAQKLYPNDIRKPIDIRSPAGFVHGYDLGLIFIKALDQIVLIDGIERNRDNVRIALENLEGKVEGLIKNYSRPFGVFSSKNFDAHEALSAKEYCMAAYGPDNEIVLR